MEKPTGTQQSEAGMSRSYVVTGGSRGIGRAVVGDAADEKVTERAADLAMASGTLTGWVNNAAIFRDASIHSAGARTVLDLVALNLNPAVVGCATAIRRFQATGTPGAIVNLSSYQARQAVPGCTPYVTPKQPSRDSHGRWRLNTDRMAFA